MKTRYDRIGDVPEDARSIASLMEHLHISMRSLQGTSDIGAGDRGGRMVAC